MAKKETKAKTQPVTHVVTAGTTIRFEQPKGRRAQPQPRIIVMPADINPVSGFVDFLREHAIVGLAIGFVIGTQVQSLVKQLVSSFIDPLFKLLFGEALSQRTFTLNWHGRAAAFGWGAFVYGILDFMFVLAAVYAIVKMFNLDNLDKPKTKSKSHKQQHLQIVEEVREEVEEDLGIGRERKSD